MQQDTVDVDLMNNISWLKPLLINPEPNSYNNNIWDWDSLRNGQITFRFKCIKKLGFFREAWTVNEPDFFLLLMTSLNGLGFP